MKKIYYISFLLLFFTVVNAQETNKEAEASGKTIYLEADKHPAADLNNPDTVYPVKEVDAAPEYPDEGTWGFIKEIMQNIDVSDNGAPSGFETRCYISFVVEKDGTLSNHELVLNCKYDFGKEVLEGAKKITKKWQPGMYGGNPVRCRYILPVTINIP